MNNKKSISDFIRDAINIHKEKYDYSLVNYKNTNTKVKIICPIHGIFEKSPKNHLNNKQGCIKCSNDKKSKNKKYTLQIFIEKANLKHKNKYDYSLVNYKNSKTKIEILCPIHNIFRQTPSSHLNNNGCIKCSNSNKKTTKQFIKDAKNIHKEKYDYSLVNYKNNNTKVKIICFDHGIFIKTPINHLNNKQGCPKCSLIKKSLHSRNDNKHFIKKAKLVHKNKYNYSLVKYIKDDIKVKIICPIHGVYIQTPKNHINLKQNCPYCSKKIFNKNDFIKEAKKIHGNIYDYSLVDYKNNSTKVKIICSDHGIFQQTTNAHIQNKSGCPKCLSSKGEIKIRNFLNKHNIKHIEQKMFNDCLSYKFYKLKFDFYIKEYNLIIEYDGKQHFEPIKYFGGYKKFKELKYNDYIKNKYCENNNINLIRIPYFNFSEIENILENILNK